MSLTILDLTQTQSHRMLLSAKWTSTGHFTLPGVAIAAGGETCRISEEHLLLSYAKIIISTSSLPQTFV